MFSCQDFGGSLTYFLDCEYHCSMLSKWDGPDLEDPEIQADDVFQHAFQLLGVDEAEWLELRFRIFDIEDNLITKSEQRAYTNSCVDDIVFNNKRLLTCEALKRVSKNHSSNCFLTFGLTYCVIVVILPFLARLKMNWSSDKWMESPGKMTFKRWLESLPLLSKDVLR